jgi:hypothetical protein
MKSPKGLDVELPVMEIMRDALWLIWSKRTLVISRFLPAMLLLASLDWASRTWLKDDTAPGQFAFMAVSMVLSVVFATACHRMTLMPHDTLLRPGIWRREETTYLFRGVLIGLVFGLVFTLGFFPLVLVLGTDLDAIGVVVGIMVALYVSARLSVTLPEIALGRSSNFRRAWMLSDGNGSRLVLVVWIAPILLASPFLLMFFVDQSFLRYLAAFGTYITSLVSLVMLSLSYQFLIDFADDKSSGGLTQTDSSDGQQVSDKGFDA